MLTSSRTTRVVTSCPMFTFQGSGTPRSRRPADSSPPRSSPSAATRRRRGRFDARSGLKRLHENVVWSQRDNFVSVQPIAPQRDERSAGPAMPRRSPRRQTCSTQRHSGELAAGPGSSTRTTCWGAPVVPDVVVEGEPALSAGRAGRMPRRWCRGRCTSRTATSRSSATRRTACAGGSTSLVGEARRRRSASAGDPVRRVARPATGCRTAVAGQGRIPDSSPTRTLSWGATPRRGYGSHRSATHRDENSALAIEIASLTWASWASPRPNDPDRLFGRAPVRPGSRVRSGCGRGHRSRGSSATATVAWQRVPWARRSAASARLAGKFDEAYLMLLRRDMPSWLYQVGQGATTVWERWERSCPDGSIHPGP